MTSFWRSGLAFLLMLLCVVIAADVYASRMLRQQQLNTRIEELQALANVAQAHPPDLDNSPATEKWLAEIAASGTRITILQTDGRIVADSEKNDTAAVDSAVAPEIRQALSAGQGYSSRGSDASKREVYLAVREPASWGRAEIVGAPAPAGVILRLSMPATDANSPIGEFRKELWGAAAVFLLIAGTITFLAHRRNSSRIHTLQDFSGRVAQGDFHQLKMHGGGELEGLARALNQTAATMEKTIGVLTDERNRSAAILRSMIEGVAVISAQERVLFSNQAFSQILGLDPGSVEGRSLIEAVRQSDLLAIIKRALTGQEKISSEIVVGTVRPRSFAVTAAPVRADGPAGAVLVLHDISEQRRLERVRQDFVANVSHEFRTPLTAIQGFAETLLNGALEDTEHRRRFVEIIRDHAARLARLTEDLLKLSRIEAGQLTLEFRPVSVFQLAESCLETARLKAGPKQIAILADITEDLPLVRGDANRLQEVLQNLLDNAVQYTPDGGSIALSAEAIENQVVITVADTGIGIPQAEQTRIFERFYRVDAARSREAGGTGLGLSIARHIVDAHGGRLWLESSVGEGSMFHFSIPISF